jgi:methylated-DNA-protein-cysteine methyltransferase-like protein
MEQKRPRFSSPPDPDHFNHLVWDLVRQIPQGMVSTYGGIAAMIPIPPGMDPKNYLSFGARWVGGAMAACPEGVPWHRVINYQGKISLRPGAEEQRLLLEGEGIVFDQRDRINLARFGWDGKSEG